MGQIGFHKSEVHADLRQHEDWLVGGGDHRVLVPLCGKTLDLDWIARKGNTAVGIELSEIAVREVFEQAGKTPEVTELHDGLKRFRAGRLVVLCGDFFKVRPDDVGPVDRVWDRAAMVALPPAMRADYVPHLRNLVEPGARVLLNTLQYNDCAKEGPPHSIAVDEIERLYRGAELELFERRDLSHEISPAWAEAGMTRFVSLLHRIVLPGGR